MAFHPLTVYGLPWQVLGGDEEGGTCLVGSNVLIEKMDKMFCLYVRAPVWAPWAPWTP